MSRLPLYCLIFALAVLAWSGINPVDRFTWWLEIIPALIAGPLLIITYKRFRFTNLLYVLMTIHACILMVGGHYTYAKVPLFDELRDIIGGVRNSYDGVGHLAQGFVPAMVIRELMTRTSPLRPGKWMAAVIIFSCLGISAVYEIIEWLTAIGTGDSAEAFLGTQGDVWDTQKDMLLAGIGAMLALLILSRVHDRAMQKLK